MIIYTSIPTTLYDVLISKDWIKSWAKTCLGEEIESDDVLFPNTLVEEWLKTHHTDKIGLEREHLYNKEIFYPAIDKSDVFIYTNDFVKEGGSYFTEGVKKELMRSIDKRKNIFRWVRSDIKANVNDVTNVSNVISLSKKALTPLILKTSKRLDWVLKSVQDYEKWFVNNPEAIPFLDKQFRTYKGQDGTVLSHGMVSHFNSLYRTYNHTKVAWTYCKSCMKYAQKYGIAEAGGGLSDKHAYMMLTKQYAHSICPLTGSGTESPGFSGRKLDFWGENSKIEQLLKTRTLHKTTLILKPEAFVTGIGISEDMSSEVKIRQANKLVAGVEPLFDFDISEVSKKAGLTFFSPEIYDEYCKIQDLMHKVLPDWFPGREYEFSFSGNGLNCKIKPIVFDQTNWLVWRVYWLGMENWHVKALKEKFDKDKDKDLVAKEVNRYGLIPKLAKLLTENGITHIVTEKKYGWNRYFKAVPTFHASKERLAIPLNRDEPLGGNKKWLDEITNIKLGLEGNVMKEIIKRADWRW